MKIGLIIYGSLDNISGGFLYDRLLVDHLQSRGDRVEVISLPWPSYRRGLLDNFSPGLRQRLQQLDCQLLIQDELIHPSFFRLNRKLRRRLGCPVIALVHHLRASEAHPFWRQRFYRWVERQYLKGVDGFICVSRATRGEVKKLAGDSRPLVVAHPGGNRLPGAASQEQIATRARAPGPLEIVFIGNLIPRKELHTLVAALAAIPRPGWRLKVVGNLSAAPGYVEKIRRQIERRDLTSRVDLLGTLDSRELALLLARSHLLAVPSSYEGFGIVYLEGMGFGLPAIGSTAGGAKEIINPGRDGFLVEPGDVATLAGHLERLLLDRGLLLQMGLAARANFECHPTWEESLSSIHGFLHSFKA